MGDARSRPTAKQGGSREHHQGDGTTALAPERRADLHASAISDQVLDRLHVRDDSKTGKGWLLDWSDRQPFQHNGEEHKGYAVFIPDRDKRRTGKDGEPIKVEWPPGLTLIPNILRHETENTRTLVTEGARQQLAALSYAPDGFNVVGMNGADGIHKGIADRLGWAAGRTVYLIVDADHESNDRVRGAVQRVAGHLRRAGAESARLVDLAPHKVKDNDGLDDVLARLPEDERAPFLAQLLDQAQEIRRDGALATLPESFWTSRPALAHIRQAAHARGRSADLVLAATLARLSAMLDPGLRLDTGLGQASLNLFVAVIGRSGIGKSTGAAAARELERPPEYLADPFKFRDGLPIGSGEGLVEAFMGTVLEETGELTKKGEPKLARVRKQVRRNVFVFVDEGQALTAMMSRSGATIGPVFRSAFGGELLGQANAREETTRVLEAGTYSLGLVIGFQRTTAGPLLDDAGAGTPQRFLWCSAVDAGVPDVPPEHPGPLVIEDLEEIQPFGSIPRTGLVAFAHEIRAELWQANLARVRGDDQDLDDDLDSHASLVRCKVAGLLAILDGRGEVDAEDWQLAGQVHDTSREVRQDLVQFGHEQAAKEHEARTDAYVIREVRAAAAREQAPAKVERVAAQLARKVHEKGTTSHRDAKKILASRDRDLFPEALNLAQDRGWLEMDEDGRKITPGASRPADS